MKRIITLVLVLCLALSLFACAKTPDNTNNQNLNKQNINTNQNEHSLFVPFENIGESICQKTDVFLAKVISKSKAPENIVFQEIKLKTETPVLYVVEVADVFRTFSVEKGERITIIRLEQELTSDGYFAKELKVGKNHLIAGTVQLVNEKPVIVDTSAISCELVEDKKLVPLSNQAEIYFENIPTLDSFINNSDVKTAFEKNINIPIAFEAYRNSLASKTKLNDMQLSDVIKQAISIDSKQTIKVTPSQYEKSYRGLYDLESLQIYLDTVIMTRLGESTDVFTGEVISKSKQSVTEKDFGNGQKPIIYTVKIKNIYRSLSVNQDMIVNVVRLTKQEDTMGNETSELEIGKTYFFVGTVDLINQKPIIVDKGNLTCQILEDGSLVSISSSTDLIYENITKFESLLNVERLQALKNYEQVIPSNFKFLEDKYGSTLKVSEVIKQAIPVDSKKTIEVPEK